ncbi:MAG: c-type cytochrome [Actinomycetota bacterium]
MARPPEGGGPPPPEKVPPALRPGDTDDVLEGQRLNRIIFWGVVMSLIFALFVFIYWVREPSRTVSQEEKFKEVSIERGRQYFALHTDPETGEENLRAIECARCHGVKAQGGTNEFLDPATGKKRQVSVPELRGVFDRYKKPPPGFKDARDYITNVIARVRTDGVLGQGADMPIWSNKFGGPLTEQQIDDIVNYLETIQGATTVQGEATPEQIFNQKCAPCHGQGGSGGIGPAFVGGSGGKQFPNLEDHIAFVKAGSKAGQPYGVSGKGTGGMPAWEGQLTDEQIRMVVEYERNL